MGVPAVLLLYRRDRDVPPWTGLRTAGCHLTVSYPNRLASTSLVGRLSLQKNFSVSWHSPAFRVGREHAGKLGRPPERNDVICLHEHGSRLKNGAARARCLEPVYGGLSGKALLLAKTS
jgi:hypothetical protein